jgi:hypothetical protein
MICLSVAMATNNVEKGYARSLGLEATHIMKKRHCQS